MNALARKGCYGVCVLKSEVVLMSGIMVIAALAAGGMLIRA